MPERALPEITRVGAYAICRDESDRVLLVRLSRITPRPGFWTLPGGGINFGEDPSHAVIRELREETGLEGRIRRLRTVASAVYDVSSAHPDDGHRGRHHAIRVVYDVDIIGGALEREASGSSDAAAWFSLAALGDIDLTPHARKLLLGA